MDTVAFSQRDVRWAEEMLGTGTISIGQAGCLISSLAALLATWGVATDPGRLNRQVTQQCGFVDDNLLEFASVDGLGCRFAEYVSCYTEPAPVERLSAAIGGGAGVLALVDATPGGRLQPHWVWLQALTATSGQIMDPWQTPGNERQSLARYLASGWNPARGIFAAAIYSRLDESRAVAIRGGPHQPAMCVRADE